YPSYGDTYPTFMGAIGMTYEQAGHGRAGLGINTDEGNVLTLNDRVAHHTTTGLSTIEVASNNAAELNAEFNAFFNNTTNKASYILNGSQDKIDAVTNLLDKHEIAYNYGNSGNVSGYNYNTQKNGSMKMTTSSLIISANQPKGKMVTTLFEPQTKIADSLTYDITAWSIPYAYGLDAVATTKSVSGNTSRQRSDISNNPMTSSAGYISKWDSMKDARFLSELLKAGINVRFSEKAFTNANTDFEKGSLIITRSDNTSLENFDTLVTTIANTQQRQLNTVTSSFANNGPDFGSPDIKRINKQKIAVLTGDYTSSLSYGELWHFFETQLHYPITSINTNNFSGIHLGDYDVLIIPDGYYGSYFDESKLGTLKEFV
ncbi:MAG TPA: zinc carboxypeptidase, partial [Flavobacteriaceae bacterium]|nr:zinc carboxypeptidase [Flavobacteriaceae bacterium]